MNKMNYKMNTSEIAEKFNLSQQYISDVDKRWFQKLLKALVTEVSYTEAFQMISEHFEIDYERLVKKISPYQLRMLQKENER